MKMPASTSYSPQPPQMRRGSLWLRRCVSAIHFGGSVALRVVQRLVAYLRRIGPLFSAGVARELLIPVLCFIATGSGILSSAALLNAKVLPLVYGTLPANLEITPVLAVPLTALVVTIHTYNELLHSDRPATLMKLLDCYCAGLLWPYWIATPLFDRLKRVLPNRSPKSQMPNSIEMDSDQDADRPSSAASPALTTSAPRAPADPARQGVP